MKNNILLKNLMFYGFHGAFEHERELGQRYYLDVQMEVDFDKAALSDDLSDAVNYVEIYNLIKDIVENKRFCEMHNLTPDCGSIIPGSGVNLIRFQLMDYPNDDTVKFIFISRIMKQKGIEQYLDTAIAIREEYPNTEFHILGYCEDAYQEKLKKLNNNKTIIYHGMTSDVRPFIANVHCIVHPTYYPEGMSNVLLESCASGRPVITTNLSRGIVTSMFFKLWARAP